MKRSIITFIIYIFLFSYYLEPNIKKINKNHIWGIDISRYSGIINWEKLKIKKPHFVLIKATEGIDLKDTSFDKFWKESKKNNILRSAYHFFVTEDDGKQQADFFLSILDLQKGDMLPVVDIEVIGHDTTGDISKKLKKFLNRIEKKIGIKPIIYTSPKFWNKHMNNTFGNYPLWIAQYGVSEPKLPKGWKKWTFWQYKGNVKLAGIEKDVDLNLFNSKNFNLKDFIINKNKPEIK